MRSGGEFFFASPSQLRVEESSNGTLSLQRIGRGEGGRGNGYPLSRIFRWVFCLLIRSRFFFLHADGSF